MLATFVAALGVREAIEARGATLRYLPKYSPDLNPIEMPFSKLKAYLRKAGERTIPRLRRRIGLFARDLTAREASNYFSSGVHVASASAPGWTGEHRKRGAKVREFRAKRAARVKLVGLGWHGCVSVCQTARGWQVLSSGGRACRMYGPLRLWASGPICYKFSMMIF